MGRALRLATLGVPVGGGDSIMPTVTITSAVALVDSPFTATFTFSEDVEGFVVGDITAGNATLSAFAAASAGVYTVLVTPTAPGEVTLDVDAAVCVDAAGNPNEAATQLSMTYYPGLIEDDFSADSGDWLDGELSPAAIAVSDGRAIWSQSLDDEIVTNGDFSAWTGDDPDSLAVTGESGGDPEVTERDPDQGHADSATIGGAANLYSSATNNQPTITPAAYSKNKFYRIEVVANVVAGNGYVYSYNGDITASGTHIRSFIAHNASNSQPLVRGKTAPTDVTIDSLSAKPIAETTLFRVQRIYYPSLVGARLRSTLSSTKGVVFYKDSTNYIVLFHTYSGLKMFKRVGTAITQVWEVNSPFVQDTLLELIPNATFTAFSVRYGGVQYATDVAITDWTADVSDGVFTQSWYAGMMCTYESGDLAVESFSHFRACRVGKAVEATLPTIVLIPDTHYDALITETNLDLMADWIAANKTTHNIQLVIHLGDAADGFAGTGTRLSRIQAFRTAIAPIVAAGIPFSPSIGNHEYDSDRTVTSWNRSDTFGAEFFAGMAWHGSTFEDDLGESAGADPGGTINRYALFTIDQTDYLLLTLELGPRDKVMAWAENLALNVYNDRKVIVVTHSYLYGDGTRTSAGDTHNPQTYTGFSTTPGDEYTNDGEDLWTKYLADWPNLVAVFSGHHLLAPSDHVQSESVRQIYDNFQVWGLTAGVPTKNAATEKAAMICLLKLDRSTQSAYIQHLWPVSGTYSVPPLSQFSWDVAI